MRESIVGVAENHVARTARLLTDNVDDVLAFLAEEDTPLGRPEHAYAAANILARAGRLDEARTQFQRSLSAGDAASIRRAAAVYGIEI